VSLEKYMPVPVTKILLRKQLSRKTPLKESIKPAK
jgi:hypothetical protein